MDGLAAFREAQRNRARRRRARSLLFLVLLSLTLAGVSAVPFVSGRALEPVLGFGRAASAIEDARSSGADEWAPTVIASADSSLQAARVERSLQKQRLAPLRNFGQVRILLDEARLRADLAAAGARSGKAAVRTDSELAIARAMDALSEAEAFRDAKVLDASARRRLQSARVHAREALAKQQDGDYIVARELAETVQKEADAILDRATERAARFVDVDEIERWSQWVSDTIEESRRGRSSAIVVFKERNELVLYKSGQIVRRYDVEMARKSLERKIMEGDGAMPEGQYRVVTKKEGGATIYYRALLLDYPNPEDLRRLAEAKRRGQVRRDASPGGLIEIHGDGGRGWDWTRGCVAMTNEDIDDLWDRVAVGTPVTIVGGDGMNGTYSRMVRAASKRRN